MYFGGKDVVQKKIIHSEEIDNSIIHILTQAKGNGSQCTRKGSL